MYWLWFDSEVENLKPYNSCNLQVDVDAKFLAYFISFTNIYFLVHLFNTLYH